MRLYIITLITLFFSTSLQAHILMVYQDINITKELSKRFTLRIENELEFANGLAHLVYAYTEPILLFNASPNLAFGPHLRLGNLKLGEAANELQIGGLIQKQFTIKGLDFFSRLKVSWRSIEDAGNSTPIRALLAVDLIRGSKATLYIGDEIFYDYFGSRKIDNNYAFIGIKNSKPKRFDFEFYYIYQISRLNIMGFEFWLDSHVLGFVANFNF